MRSFKSVGITEEEAVRQSQAVATTPIPIGIITPLHLGSNDEGLLAMSYDVGLQLKNNLRDLIMTNWGERLGIYDFGANLTPLTTEYEKYGKDGFDSLAMERILKAVNKYMPYVVLDSFDSQRTYAQELAQGNVFVIIDYNIPRANVGKSRLQINFTVV
jgi:phage baseplate assembly protein W